MRADLIAAIETLTHRRVAAFMLATHLEPDMAAEIFVLDRPVGRGSADADPVEPVVNPRRPHQIDRIISGIGPRRPGHNPAATRSLSRAPCSIWRTRSALTPSQFPSSCSVLAGLSRP